MLRNNADVRQCSYFELGLPLAVHTINKAQDSSTFLPGGGGWGLGGTYFPLLAKDVFNVNLLTE